MDDVTGVRSIRELSPLESGGVVARQGFDFQDHVAAGFVIDMIAKPDLREVWCETHDDITLVWGEEDRIDLVEFVQAKKEDPGHYWTVASLCRRDADRPGTSVFERSLAHDRCSEPCGFRMVTSVETCRDLRVLKLTPDHTDRQWAAEPAFYADVRERVGDHVSLNGNGCDQWLNLVRWETPGSPEAVRDRNLRALTKLVEGSGNYLASDQTEELYQRFLRLVRDAANADWRSQADGKKLLRRHLVEWLEEGVATVKGLTVAAGDETPLARKLSDAGLPDDYFGMARLQRLRYTSLRRGAGYLDLEPFEAIEGAVRAKLQLLKSELDAGVVPDDGVGFHRSCLEALGQMPRGSTFAVDELDVVLQGYMYEVTNRCLHRFRRVSI